MHETMAIHSKFGLSLMTPFCFVGGSDFIYVVCIDLCILQLDTIFKSHDVSVV